MGTAFVPCPSPRRWYGKSYISGHCWLRIVERGSPRTVRAAKSEWAAPNYFRGDGTRDKEAADDSDCCVKIWKNLLPLLVFLPISHLKT
jgi:hypothetical protein